MDREEMTNVLGHEPLTFEQMKELKRMYLQHDWEALRNQAAISVLSATVLREGPDYLTACRHMKEQVSEAIEYADLLIEELKKEKEG